MGGLLGESKGTVQWGGGAPLGESKGRVQWGAHWVGAKEGYSGGGIHQESPKGRYGGGDPLKVSS